MEGVAEKPRWEPEKAEALILTDKKDGNVTQGEDMHMIH